MFEKPSEIFGRTYEWSDLVRFVTQPSPSLRIGVVRGRRRRGKSFLLDHLCRAAGGIYTLAVQQTRTMALDRFAASLSQALGYQVGPFRDWVVALDTAVDSIIASNAIAPILVLDEFPYLVDHSSELPSVIQALYDLRWRADERSRFDLILCGSAISVMSTLLRGDQALRGRAVLNMRIEPFRFRDAAEYWGCSPETAFLIDAVVGSAPGYLDVVGESPKPGPEGFYQWLDGSLFNPAHILFTEPDFFLSEEPRVSDRAIYYAIWEAISRGATTPTKIGGLVGIDAKVLGYHLRIMRDAGFIRDNQDALLQRKPTITVADPSVRFHNLIIQPNIAEFERRDSRPIWERSQRIFTANILGPHFEELAREWLRWYGHEMGLDDVNHISTTVVSCQEHRGHEVDVVGLSRESLPQNRNAKITVLGEAKCTAQPRTIGDLERLAHIREVLVGQGWDAQQAKLVLFSRASFTDDLRRAADQAKALLVDLPMMYGKSSS